MLTMVTLDGRPVHHAVYSAVPNRCPEIKHYTITGPTLYLLYASIILIDMAQGGVCMQRVGDQQRDG